MKRKDIYLLAIIFLAITLAFALVTGLIYLQKTNQIKKITVKSKQDVSIIEIRNLYEQYEFITDEDTYYVNKEYHSDVDLNAIEQIDLKESFNIKYAGAELVSLKNNSQNVFEIDLIKAKTAERDAFASEAFYWCITICSVLFFATILGMKLNERTLKKVEKNILLIPNTTKVGEQLFQYRYNEIKFMLFHMLTSKRNVIRVYIPAQAENLIRPNSMHTEKINNLPYCYFDYRLFNSKVTPTKLQAKINSKIIKAV